MALWSPPAPTLPRSPRSDGSPCPQSEGIMKQKTQQGFLMSAIRHPERVSKQACEQQLCVCVAPCTTAETDHTVLTTPSVWEHVSEGETARSKGGRHRDLCPALSKNGSAFHTNRVFFSHERLPFGHRELRHKYQSCAPHELPRFVSLRIFSVQPRVKKIPRRC